MSDNKEEKIQVPTPEELDAAIKLIPLAYKSDFWVEELGWIGDPDYTCYIRAPDSARLYPGLLEVPESISFFPGQYGFQSRSFFTFFRPLDDFLKTRDLLVFQYVENNNVKSEALQEIILRRDALYETLIFSSDVIRDALAQLRSIIAVPLLVLLENIGRDWDHKKILEFWLPISFGIDGRGRCLERVAKWLAGIDVSSVIKRGLTEGVWYWLGVRDAVLLGGSVESDNPTLFDWDDPGAQSALARHMLWFFLDELALAAITDSKVKTDLSESPFSLLPRGNIHGNRKLSDAQEEEAIRHFSEIINSVPLKGPLVGSFDAYTETIAWVKKEFSVSVSIRKLQRIQEEQLAKKGRSE